MNEEEKTFAFLLLMYFRFKLIACPPPPYIPDEQFFCILLLFQMYQEYLGLVTMPLPFFNIRLRDRILEQENQEPLTTNNVYATLCNRPYEFWILSGETVRSFDNLVIMISQRIPQIRFGNSYVSLKNRVLLTLIWLRQYPTYTLLSLSFGLSVANVGKLINNMWVLLWEVCSPLVTWPSVQEWTAKQGHWREMANVVGSIDGTSHEILVPMVEPQQEFYSGHRNYHCIHTQVR